MNHASAARRRALRRGRAAWLARRSCHEMLTSSESQNHAQPILHPWRRAYRRQGRIVVTFSASGGRACVSRPQRWSADGLASRRTGHSCASFRLAAEFRGTRPSNAPEWKAGVDESGSAGLHWLADRRSAIVLFDSSARISIHPDQTMASNNNWSVEDDPWLDDDEDEEFTASDSGPAFVPPPRPAQGATLDPHSSSDIRRTMPRMVILRSPVSFLVHLYASFPMQGSPSLRPPCPIRETTSRSSRP